MMDTYFRYSDRNAFHAFILFFSALVGPTAQGKGMLKCQPRHGNGTTTGRIFKHMPD